jgi:hypothetical protein
MPYKTMLPESAIAVKRGEAGGRVAGGGGLPGPEKSAFANHIIPNRLGIR